MPKKEKMEYLTSWQRERADFQNYKKDEGDAPPPSSEVARETFVEELLPVLDAYDMAFAKKTRGRKVDKNWRMGVDISNGAAFEVLAQNGVEPLKSQEGDASIPFVTNLLTRFLLTRKRNDHKIAAVISPVIRQATLR